MAAAPAKALFISDVPGHDPAVIGSGLMGPSGEGDRIERTVIASIDHAMERVRAEAEKCGLVVWKDARVFDAPADRMAGAFLARAAHEREPGLRVGRRIHRAASRRAGTRRP
ncbi:MAG: hypothetical protein WDO56_10025 [Gammaproteobacteria bacterium]